MAEPHTTEGAAVLRVALDRRLLPERFLIVSNRPPYQIKTIDGEIQLERTPGGLASALDLVMRLTGGSWL